MPSKQQSTAKKTSKKIEKAVNIDSVAKQDTSMADSDMGQDTSPKARVFDSEAYKEFISATAYEKEGDSAGISNIISNNAVKSVADDATSPMLSSEAKSIVNGISKSIATSEPISISNDVLDDQSASNAASSIPIDASSSGSPASPEPVIIVYVSELSAGSKGKKSKGRKKYANIKKDIIKESIGKEAIDKDVAAISSHATESINSPSQLENKIDFLKMRISLPQPSCPEEDIANTAGIITEGMPDLLPAPADKLLETEDKTIYINDQSIGYEPKAVDSELRSFITEDKSFEDNEARPDVEDKLGIRDKDVLVYKPLETEDKLDLNDNVEVEVGETVAERNLISGENLIFDSILCKKEFPTNNEIKENGIEIPSGTKETFDLIKEMNEVDNLEEHLLNENKSIDNINLVDNEIADLEDHLVREKEHLMNENKSIDNINLEEHLKEGEMANLEEFSAEEHPTKEQKEKTDGLEEKTIEEINLAREKKYKKKKENKDSEKNNSLKEKVKRTRRRKIREDPEESSPVGLATYHGPGLYDSESTESQDSVSFSFEDSSSARDTVAVDTSFLETPSPGRNIDSSSDSLEFPPCEDSLFLDWQAILPFVNYVLLGADGGSTLSVKEAIGPAIVGDIVIGDSLLGKTRPKKGVDPFVFTDLRFLYFLKKVCYLGKKEAVLYVKEQTKLLVERAGKSTAKILGPRDYSFSEDGSRVEIFYSGKDKDRNSMDGTTCVVLQRASKINDIEVPSFDREAFEYLVFKHGDNLESISRELRLSVDSSKDINRDNEGDTTRGTSLSTNTNLTSKSANSGTVDTDRAEGGIKDVILVYYLRYFNVFPEISDLSDSFLDRYVAEEWTMHDRILFEENFMRHSTAFHKFIINKSEKDLRIYYRFYLRNYIPVNWSLEERTLFAHLFGSYKKDWAAMQKSFPRKTPQDLRVYYASYFKKLGEEERIKETQLVSMDLPVIVQKKRGRKPNTEKSKGEES